MKIALIGYGKMGKTIEALATAEGHEIVLKVGIENLEDLTIDNLKKADVAIEFTQPESAFEHVKLCLEAAVPVVCGTTAWLDQLPEAKRICNQKKGAFFYASNFSIGVNIFFAINRMLARKMATQTEYEVEMEEIHHTQKLDAPSGTAITLAEGILENLPRKQSWVNETSPQPEQLSIISKRIDNVPGTHTVTYHSSVDSITINHTVHTREGFARGAIQAAGWIIGRQGFFGMEDMLGI